MPTSITEFLRCMRAKWRSFSDSVNCGSHYIESGVPIKKPRWSCNLTRLKYDFNKVRLSHYAAVPDEVLTAKLSLGKVLAKAQNATKYNAVKPI